MSARIIRYEIKNGKEYALVKLDHATPQYTHIISREIENGEQEVLAQYSISAPSDKIAMEWATDYVKADN